MDSRSAIISIVIAIATIFFQKEMVAFLKKKYRLLFLLNIPLIIAVLVANITDQHLLDTLNKWSAHNTSKKTFFNGRNEIWMESFRELKKTTYLGIMYFQTNYHNSAVACLTAFGIGGYITWINSLYIIIKRCIRRLDDTYVYGSICAFFIIFVQQSVELGFITPTPNMIPYMCLGISLSRAKYTKRISYGNNNKHHNTSI